MAFRDLRAQLRDHCVRIFGQAVPVEWRDGMAEGEPSWTARLDLFAVPVSGEAREKGERAGLLVPTMTHVSGVWTPPQASGECCLRRLVELCAAIP